MEEMTSLPTPASPEQPVGTPPAAPSANKRNILPLISLAIGVVILLLGIVTAFRKADVTPYEAQRYSVSHVTFGADFYTEIYNASDTIVEELSDMNGGLAVLSASAVSAINAVYFSAGMIVIALGLGTIAVSCVFLKKEG